MFTIFWWGLLVVVLALEAIFPAQRWYICFTHLGFCLGACFFFALDIFRMKREIRELRKR